MHHAFIYGNGPLLNEAIEEIFCPKKFSEVFHFTKFDDLKSNLKSSAPKVLLWVDNEFSDLFYEKIRIANRLSEGVRHVVYCQNVCVSKNQKIVDIFATGSLALLTSSDTIRDLKAAVENAIEGEPYLTPRICRVLLNSIRDSKEEKDECIKCDELLTRRETEVLSLIVDGKSNKDIALILDISVRTVESHRDRIMKKMNVSGCAHLISEAFKRGYAAVK